MPLGNNHIFLTIRDTKWLIPSYLTQKSNDMHVTSDPNVRLDLYFDPIHLPLTTMAYNIGHHNDMKSCLTRGFYFSLKCIIIHFYAWCPRIPYLSHTLKLNLTDSCATTYNEKSMQGLWILDTNELLCERTKTLNNQYWAIFSSILALQSPLITNKFHKL